MPIIKNNSGSLLGIGLANGKILLYPGNNKVEDSEWSEAKENRVIKAKIKDGIIVENEVKKSFSDLTVAEQKSLIKGTFDMTLLESYLDEAKGKAKLEVEAQIKKISGDDE